MDNDAFRALINSERRQNSTSDNNKNNGGKSTREIAREAVQEEFRRKRHGSGGRRRGRRNNGSEDDGYGSSSDEDGRQREGDAAIAKNETNEPEWKRRRREIKQSSNPQQQVGYRDRAKERREGTNLDYAPLEFIAASTNDYAEDRRTQAELSKYLGGDEEHTHLVKGLDWALAQKVRREEMGESVVGIYDVGEADLDRLMEEEYTKKEDQRHDRSDADKFDRSGDWRTLKPKSDLGVSMLRYLRRHQQNKQKYHLQSGSEPSSSFMQTEVEANQTVQKSIKGTVLDFSLECDVRRRRGAWEVPRLSSQVISSKSVDDDNFIRRGTQFDPQFIRSLNNALVQLRRRYDTKSGKGDTKIDDHAQVEKKSVTVGPLSHDKVEKTSVAHEAKVDNDIKTYNQYDDESDENIFDDIDGMYIPPSKPDNLNEAKKENCDSDEKIATEICGKFGTSESKGKVSIFKNLTTAEEQPTANHASLQTRRPIQIQNTQQPLLSDVKKNVINRDVFSGKSYNMQPSSQKRRGPTSASFEGVSMAKYDGGYGEYIDVDFGNADEDDRQYDEHKVLHLGKSPEVEELE
mmetsp:Transcript_9540/g.20302  ORF Transcript_9540/g.20302 Transcript_9540/m.20302 type:complete len:575 (-) Transcript_9540:216-1940(-)